MKAIKIFSRLQTYDHIRNEDIRKELKIPTITETIETSGMNTF